VTEVAIRPGETGALAFRPQDVFAQMEEAFPLERRKQIAAFLSIDADHPAMLPLLAISAAYGLNPMMGEIWLIPKAIREKRNGKWETVGYKYSPSVGRDGLLSRARRDPSYIGTKFSEVCANDEFSVEESADFMDPPLITHRKKGGRAERGAVIGAWALVRLKGRPYTYYFADITEHGRTKTTDTGVKWDGAWDYTSTMIIKSAVSYALRLSLGITGVVPLDELSPEDRRQYGIDPDAEKEEEPRQMAELPPEFWEEVEGIAGPDVANRLVIATSSWQPARIEMTLTGRSAAELSTLLEQLEGPAEEIREAEIVDEDENKAPEEEPVKLNENADRVDDEPDAPVLDEKDAGDPPAQEPML
jgi:hypothetical protein